MVQTVKSIRLQPGQQGIFIKRPHVLSRIFFKIVAILPQTVNYLSKISFDDPLFVDYYTLLGENISPCYTRRMMLWAQMRFSRLTPPHIRSRQVVV